MIKKYYRKLYRAWLGEPLQKEDFQFILKDLLGLEKGDSVLVHASFGNLKAGFSTEEAVEILVDIIGENGNLLMPYYPSDSVDWLKNGRIFDVRTTPTRSGILSSTFAKFPGVKKSVHPIKSLAVWGKDRDALINSHYNSKTPFDLFSPYYKLLSCRNAKAIGLGVYKNLVVHTAEDNIDIYPRYYSNVIYEGKCKNYDGRFINVKTPVHTKNNMVPSCEYLRLSNCPSYKEISYKKRRFYTSDYISAYNHIKKIVYNNNLTADVIKKNQSIKDYLTSKFVRI